MKEAVLIGRVLETMETMETMETIEAVDIGSSLQREVEAGVHLQ